MDKTVISVIVPIYNVAHYLDKCISSIIGQTYDNLEIILVDDGSTDCSGWLCDEYRKKDSRIKVIHKQNGGLVSARKAGLYAALGEYVGYVDGDDWIEPNFYEKLTGYQNWYQVDMIETDYYIDVGIKCKRVKSKIAYGKYDVRELIPIMLCDRDFNECRLRPYLWSKLFKKELLKHSQMRVEESIQCGEDIAVTYPYILSAEYIYIADYAGYHYVQHQDSMTGMYSSSGSECDKALILYLKMVFESDRSYSDIMLEQLNQYTKSMLLLRQPSFFDRKSDKKKLLPFGGIVFEYRIALYGAGKMGQSVYQYLRILYKEKAILWSDKEYLLYQRMGLPIISPEEIVAEQGKYDKLLIVVSSRAVSESIKNFLYKKGLAKDKAVWLSEEFVNEKNKVLEDYLR